MAIDILTAVLIGSSTGLQALGAYTSGKAAQQSHKAKAQELKEEIKHLFIRSDRADHKVLFSEILLIEGKKDYVKVSLLNKSYLVRKNLKTFLSELPESKFVRISKSVALNTEQIEKIDKNMLFVKSGNYYIIGKKYNQAIKELLK